MPGLRYQVPCAKYQVLGYLLPGYQVLGYVRPDTRDLAPGACYLAPGAWYLVRGSIRDTGYLVPGTWYMLLGTWYQVPGTWYLQLLGNCGHYCKPSPSIGNAICSHPADQQRAGLGGGGCSVRSAAPPASSIIQDTSLLIAVGAAKLNYSLNFGGG